MTHAQTTPPADDPGNPPPDVFEQWLKHCQCCQECDLAPCAAVAQGGVCENGCRCDEREEAREAALEDDFDRNACPGCGGTCQTACR